MRLEHYNEINEIGTKFANDIEEFESVVSPESYLTDSNAFHSRTIKIRCMHGDDEISAS
jgi:hypothetical protein